MLKKIQQRLMRKLCSIFSYLKKGRSFLLLPFFMFVASCVGFDLSRDGRVTLHNTGDRNSFTFIVSDDFTANHEESPQDKENPKLNEAEAKLLKALLKEKKYCLENQSQPLFTITSRQEKVFDMTFAHLIEENYRARPIVPRTYFGQCKTK